MGVFVRVVAAGIRYDVRSNDVLPPYLKFDVLKNITNNVVHIKYINYSIL